ncbi:MAG: hypothetical protein N2253_09200 [Bacteroidia bacterium]|nr:hypothetical protein [Bacteroidia bacterium]
MSYDPTNPSGRQYFFYTDLGGGRVRIEIRDTVWNPDQNRCELQARTLIWTPSSRWMAQQEPDSAIMQVYDGGNLRYFLKQYSFFRNNRLDSMFIWLNIRYLFNLSTDLYAAGYTLYFYDAQNRLARERDTAWLISPTSAPASAGMKWYFYQGNSTRPSKDSSYTREYALGGGVDRGVTFYTYDSNGNLIVAEEDTCAQANPANCQDYKRTLYSYIRQQTPASLDTQLPSVKAKIPSPLRAGERIPIETHYAAPYRIVDALGRTWDQGHLPAGQTVLSLPPLSGIWIIQIDNYHQKLLLLP